MQPHRDPDGYTIANGATRVVRAVTNFARAHGRRSIRCRRLRWRPAAPVGRPHVRRRRQQRCGRIGGRSHQYAMGSSTGCLRGRPATTGSESMTPEELFRGIHVERIQHHLSAFSRRRSNPIAGTSTQTYVRATSGDGACVSLAPTGNQTQHFPNQATRRTFNLTNNPGIARRSCRCRPRRRRSGCQILILHFHEELQVAHIGMVRHYVTTSSNVTPAAISTFLTFSNA